jgi:hypothetical protein
LVPARSDRPALVQAFRRVFSATPLENDTKLFASGFAAFFDVGTTLALLSLKEEPFPFP